jgi:hypothetical protein
LAEICLLTNDSLNWYFGSGKSTSLNWQAMAQVPILIDADGGIISGHCRVLAARQLQLEYVPVVVLDDLKETQKRSEVLAPVHRGESK